MHNFHRKHPSIHHISCKAKILCICQLQLFAPWNKEKMCWSWFKNSFHLILQNHIPEADPQTIFAWRKIGIDRVDEGRITIVQKQTNLAYGASALRHCESRGTKRLWCKLQRNFPRRVLKNIHTKRNWTNLSNCFAFTCCFHWLKAMLASMRSNVPTKAFLLSVCSLV